MKAHTKIMLGVVGGSFLLHLAAWAFVGRIKGERKHDLVAIELAEAKKKEKKKDQPKPKPVEIKPEKAKVRAPAPKPIAPPPEPTAAPPPEAKPQSMSSYADLGLGTMSGGGGPGLAVGGGGGGGGGGATPQPTATATHRHVTLAPIDDGCTEEIVKPKLQQFIKPPYSDAGRQANIEGKVRLEITIDASGNVVGVKVLHGLGYGLDEAAVSTVKAQWRFQPATRCGKAVPSTIKAGVTFTLS